eukprot:102318-Rhodomonas_salina.1
MQEEIDRVLQGRAPTYDDMSSLVHTQLIANLPSSGPNIARPAPYTSYYAPAHASLLDPSVSDTDRMLRDGASALCHHGDAAPLPGTAHPYPPRARAR